MTRPLLYDLRGKRVFVAGHKGLAGSAIVRRLADELDRVFAGFGIGSEFLLSRNGMINGA